jgi:UDP-N-acetylglucosamine 1-carboxyvinyltransferase
MDKLILHGGARLAGRVRVSGAKNAALPILAASLLTEGEFILQNVPDLMDVRTMLRLLAHMGAETQNLPKQKTALVAVRKLPRLEAPYDIVKTMRASSLVLGPLVARFGEARVSLPGGCAIGARPIDQHLAALEKMGARIDLEHGYVHARCKHLRGAEIQFDLPTVTGTENVMMAATLARGRTVLENAAREPEVEELARVLNKMGARISGAGTSVVTIEGVTRLEPVQHAIIPDRIEAGTLAVAAAMTEGDVLLEGCEGQHLEAVLAKLREAGARIVSEPKGVRVVGPRELRAIELKTLPHPGFPTDMQAQMMAMLTRARGTSVITETIFENRFMHVPELVRMGADVKIEGATAVVTGVPKLAGAPLMASDLRASAALVLAGLVAEGTTHVHRIYHLDRGYEHLERKLRRLGADVRRAKGGAT